MPNSSNDIRTLVNDFATQLEQLTKRMALEQVLEALGGEAGARAPSGKRRGRPPGSKNKAASGRRGRRSSADLEKLSASLLAHVKAHPGQRGDQIATALRSDVTTIRRPMKALIAAKKVKTKGQRRGMTYAVA